MHLEQILETLALLDLEDTNISPFVDILTKTAKIHKNEPEYWIISTYHGPDLEDVFLGLLSQGFRVVWILPYSVGLRISKEDITLSAKVRERIIFV